nr:protein MEI2-like 6 [Tanacetum cinerariifolium]
TEDSHLDWMTFRFLDWLKESMHAWITRRKLLVKFLEDHCKTQNEMVGNDEKYAFDFVYLPIDINDMSPGKVVGGKSRSTHSSQFTDMNVTLHIDGQSTEVDVPPDIIIDVVDADDDITDDEDALRYDLAESGNEDLINVDDDGVDKMSADVARSHGGDGGGKGKRKPNLGGQAAGRLSTRDKDRNLSLKEITDTKGPVLIQFELRDKQTVMPLGDHVTHWSSYIGEVIRGRTWNPPTGQRSTRASNSTSKRRTIPTRLLSRRIIRNIARAGKNQQNQAKSTVISRQGSRSLARLRDEMVLPARATDSASTPADDSTLNSLHKKVDFMMSFFKSDSKYSDMFSQFKSGGARGSGGCGGEEEGADHQDDEDEDGDGDT